MSEFTKKNRKKVFSHWTVFATLTILNALFVLVSEGRGAEDASKSRISALDDLQRRSEMSELLVLRTEIKALRQKLFDTIKKYDKHEREYERFQHSLAFALDKIDSVEGVKAQLKYTESLRRLSESSHDVAFKSLDMCQYVESMIDKMLLDDLAKTRMRYRIEELRKAAVRLGALLAREKPGKELVNCRVLRINKVMDVVVINVGMLNGVRNGLSLRTKGEQSVELKVIAVRPYIAAAIPVEGDLTKISVGMPVTVSGENK